MRLTTLVAVALGVAAAAPVVQAQGPRMMRRGTVQPAPSYVVPSYYPTVMPATYSTPVVNGQVMPGVYYPSMMPYQTTMSGPVYMPFTPAVYSTPAVSTTTSSGVVATGATSSTDTSGTSQTSGTTTSGTSGSTATTGSSVVVGQPTTVGPIVGGPIIAGYPFSTMNGTQPVIYSGSGVPVMDGTQVVTITRPARRGLFRRR